MLEKVKLALRIKHNALDDEINDLIESAKCDLRISGVKNISVTDVLIIRAVITYCKAEFDNENSERYRQAYSSLKEHLALCGEYNGQIDNIN